MHVLCCYHLVNHGMQELKPYLLGWDKDNIQSQLHTFKCWVYTWVGIDGSIETEEMFDESLQLLRTWLFNQTKSGDRNIASNAQVLDDFLMKRILYHKNRWLFVYRKHLRTLAQKATSALEGGINMTMKYKSNPVRPIMSVLQSLKAQDNQQTQRMKRWRKKSLEAYESVPKWNNSKTRCDITTVAESQLQNNFQQDGFYQCKVVMAEQNHAKIHVVRSKGSKQPCGECKTDGDEARCPCCSECSPIPKPRVRRCISIDFAYVDSNNVSWFFMKCSCPYHNTFGIPCRHVSLLLPIRSHHVQLRWKKKYAALYDRPSYEAYTRHIRGNPSYRYDGRLLINAYEFNVVMNAANRIQGERGTNDILFDHQYLFTQNKSNGVLSHSLSKDKATLPPGVMAGMYGTGCLSQESYHCEADNSCSKEFAFVSGGNKYIDRNAHLQSISNLMEGHNRVENYFDREYASLIAKCQAMLFDETKSKGGDAGASEFVSCNPVVDTRKKYIRKKSMFESKKHKKKLWPKESIDYPSYFAGSKSNPNGTHSI